MTAREKAPKAGDKPAVVQGRPRGPGRQGARQGQHEARTHGPAQPSPARRAGQERQQPAAAGAQAGKREEQGGEEREVHAAGRPHPRAVEEGQGGKEERGGRAPRRGRPRAR